VSEAAEEQHETYIYRRVIPNHITGKKSEVSIEAFDLGTAVKGLSVYRADVSNPRHVLQMTIEDRKHKLATATDEQSRVDSEKWLLKNPDVEALVEKGWRVIKVPVSEVIEMGFGLDVPDSNGHLNILGTPSQFADHKADFIELIKSGKATLLSATDCLNG